VDEVLSVGDIAFQKKCLGRMSAVAKEGRTVLFVSHNMAAVLNLCDTGILLKNGSVSCSGKASDVVQEYLATVDRWAATPLRERTDRSGNGLVQVVGCKVCATPSGEPGTDYLLGDEAYIVLTVQAHQAASILVGVQVKDAWGQLVFAFNSRESGYAPTVEPGESSLVLHIPYLPFLEGKYKLDATVNLVRDLERCDAIEQVGSFVMHPKDIYGSSVPFTSQHGVVFVKHQWVRRDAPGAQATWITSAWAAREHVRFPQPSRRQESVDLRSSSSTGTCAICCELPVHTSQAGRPTTGSDRRRQRLETTACLWSSGNFPVASSPARRTWAIPAGISAQAAKGACHSQQR
jgi:hypothetical protein